MELEGNGGTYKYELAIDHDVERLSRVKHERLWFDGQPLLRVELARWILPRQSLARTDIYL